MTGFSAEGLDKRLADYLGRTPDLDKAIFVARDAIVHGAVTLHKNASVFYGSILRGDINTIEIGEGTNIQDGTIIHLADDFGVAIGTYTTVGHGAMIHACTIGNECLIGMRATVLDGAEIGDQCLIAAGSVVTPRTKIPSGSMVMGAPARVKRELSEEERAGLRHWAEKYIVVARAHADRQAGLLNT